jgi:hypothetical protein
MSTEQEPAWEEPGVERHAWELEYEAMLPLIADEAQQALPELASLVEKMLVDRGYLTAAREGFDRSEQAVTFAAAKELSDRASRGEELDSGDVGFAIAQLQAVYESLLEDSPTA